MVEVEVGEVNVVAMVVMARDSRLIRTLDNHISSGILQVCISFYYCQFVLKYQYYFKAGGGGDGGSSENIGGRGGDGGVVRIG
jgi:hypothetical protein